MANTTIRLKKSGVVSNVPASLDLGELALNYADGKLYYKNADGLITYISSGATTNSFATINANSSLVIATSNTDILSLAGANNITINSDGISKTITIGAKLSDSLTLTEPQTGASSNAVANLYSIVQGVQSIASNGSETASLALTNSQNAFDKANSANSLAQAAFDYANTITGGGSTTTFFNYLTVEKQLHTANASQTDFFIHYTAPFVTVVVNGVTIDSSEYSTGTANTIILSTPANAGDVVDITGFSQANSATITAGGGAGTDQWVRDTANSAVANTIVTQGVDTWQNTQITAVNNYTSSAYNKANNALPLSGGTITGSITVNQDISVSGNLYVAGNTTTIGTQNLVLDDSLIYLANNNPANLVDIGMVGNFTTDHYQHTGIVRNHSNGNWIFFSNVTSEPTTTVDFSEANIVYDSITTGGVITPSATINGKDWQTVENTQNTNITLVNNLAQSAYDSSNTLSSRLNYLSNTSLEITSNTANQVIDTFSTTTWRTTKYLIQMTSGTDVHSTELFLTHNDTTVLLTQYGEIYTTNLMSLDASITSGNLSLLITPTTSTGYVDVVRTSMIARTLGSSSSGDLMLLSGTEDLGSGSGTEDLMA